MGGYGWLVYFGLLKDPGQKQDAAVTNSTDVQHRMFSVENGLSRCHQGGERGYPGEIRERSHDLACPAFGYKGRATLIGEDSSHNLSGA